METCSNCGATNRPSAKFCTSCGVRLPTLPERDTTDWDRSSTTAPATATETEPVTASTAEPGSAAETTTTDFATASTTSASPSWSSSSGEVDETERSTERGDESRTADSEPVAESSTASSWSSGERDTASDAGDAERAERTDQQPADASGTVGATTDTTDTTTEDAAPSGGDAERDTSSTLSSWASQWTGEYAAVPDADEQRTTANVSAAETQAQPETGVTGETAESGDTATATPTEESLEPAVTAAWQGQSTMTDMPQWTARSEGSESAASGPAIEPSRDDTGREDFVADTASDETDVVPRAARLLDELRALLPALATATVPTAATGEAVPSAAPNAGAVADELAASRHGGDDFAELRRALEAARSRPRDVDTMLDLVDRIDPMLAALDALDRYAAAIDRAVSQLQGGDAPSAPASSERDEGHGGHFRWHSG